MASSFASLDAAASPVNPVNSVIHLCMSVKRTVSGSVSGYLSANALAMSSKLSQPNVGGIELLLEKLLTCKSSAFCLLPSAFCLLPSDPRSLLFGLSSMIRFFRVILVPIRNLHHDVRRAIRHGLATEARLRRNPRR